MRTSIALTLTVVTLILLSPLLPKMATAQPSQGNWVVTGTQVVQNESITLNGNLTVESGGNLTLSNVGLALGVQYNGEYGVVVQPGGSLFVYSSKISSSDGKHRYSFLANGTNFVMMGSTLQDVGWCDIQNDQASSCQQSQIGTYDGTQGPLVGTSGAIISGNLISDNGVGIALAGAYDVVQNNVITSNNYSSVVIDYRQPKSGALVPLGNDTVLGNSFHQNVLLDSAMVFLESGGNLVENNTFTYTQTVPSSTLCAIEDDGSWGNTITRNSITSTCGVFVIGGSSNDLISKNNVTFCETGIWLTDVGDGDSIDGNVLNSGLVTQSNGHICGGQGIQVRGARNLTIADNTILSPIQHNSFNMTFQGFSSIELEQTYESRILDNNVTWMGRQPSLFLLDSNKNLVSGNRVSDFKSKSWATIFLEASNANTLSNNLQSSQAPYNVVLDSSNDNVLYGNDFLNASELAYSGGIGNAWSFQGVGNYWGNYSGIGAYSILPNGTDANPLASPATIERVAFTPSAPFPPPRQFMGEYSTLEVSNASIINGQTTTYVAGSIYIRAGGNLTIENSDLTMGTQSPFRIQVEAGGSLYLENDNVHWGTGAVNIAPGASAVMINTTVAITGTAPSSFDVGLGGSLTILHSVLRSSNGIGRYAICNDGPSRASITIENSVLDGGSNCSDYDSSIKITGDYTHLVFENNLMDNSPAGITDNAGGPHSVQLITNNTFRAMAYPYDAGGSTTGTVVISHNVVSSSTLGLIIDASNVTVDYNTLDKGWAGGLSVTCGPPCTEIYPVIGNIVVDAYILVAANDTTIADNTATGIQGGLTINGNANDVYGNNVSGIQDNGQGNSLHDNTITSSNTKTSTTSTSTSTTSTSTSTTSTSTSSSKSSTTRLSETSTSSGNNSSATSSGKGISEFPFQLLAAAAVTSLVALSYLLFRRRLSLSLR